MHLLWNWLRRRKPEPLRFGTMVERATEQGIRTEVREYDWPAKPQPPARFLSVVQPEQPVLSTTQRERMTTIDDLRAARDLRSAMLEIDEAAREAWQASEDYWGSDSGDEWDGGGAA